MAWFSRPSAVSLLAAVPFLILGEGLRLWAVRHAGRATRSREIGDTEVRAVAGPYAYVRHPIYLANLVLFSGAVVAGTASRPPACLALLAAVLLLLGAQYFFIASAEEEWMISRSLPLSSAPLLSWPEALRSERATLLVLGGGILFFVWCLAPTGNLTG